MKSTYTTKQLARFLVYFQGFKARLNVYGLFESASLKSTKAQLRGIMFK